MNRALAVFVFALSFSNLSKAADPVFDQAQYDWLEGKSVSNLDDLYADYALQQEVWLPASPPGTGDFQWVAGIVPFVEDGFSKSFLKNLTPHTCAPALSAYRIYLRESEAPNGRRFHEIVGPDGAQLDWRWMPSDYDPCEWIKARFPATFSSSNAEDSAYAQWLMEIYDNRRLVWVVDLLPTSNLVSFVWSQSLAQGLATEDGGVAMMMIAGPSDEFAFTNLNLSGAGLEFSLAYPLGATQSIGIVVSTNLPPVEWALFGVTNADPATDVLAFTYDPAVEPFKLFAAYDQNADTDGDGVADGEEFFLDHSDPDDAGDPPNIKGEVSYETFSGGQSGTIYVVVVTNSDSWSTNISVSLTEPGPYHLTKLSPDTYWIKAFRDSDGNAMTNGYEAFGLYSNNAVLLDGQVVNANIMMTDPDNDTDGMGDWWEKAHFGNPVFALPNEDEEPDRLKNLYEYYAGTDPYSYADSDTDGMSDDWEVYYGLDFDDPTDADGDADLDGWTNLEEYNGTNDPADELSHPSGAYYVATNGTNQVFGGGYTNPFATIAYALSQVADGNRIVIFPGLYAAGGEITNNSLLITGLEGKRETTIIDGGGTNRAFVINGRQGITVQRLTMRNGYSSTNGGAIYSSDSSLVVVECNFYTNRAGSQGGALWQLYGSTAFENCQFFENEASSGGAMYSRESYDIDVRSTQFKGNGTEAIYGGALFIDNGAVNITDCMALENGAIRYFSSTYGGFTYLNGSGGDCFYNISRCFLISNEATYGGCIYATGDAEGTVDNSVFMENHALAKGGAFLNQSDACEYQSFVNCTFTRNSIKFGQGGAVWSSLCGPSFVNCILWTNQPDGYAGSVTGSFSYCCLQDTNNLQGIGNLSQEPGLKVGGWGLKPLSPCVNAGTNLTWDVDDLDVEQQSRVAEGRVDIGADEFTMVVHYVDVNSSSPMWPYLSWTSAATTIQTAVDASSSGEFVVVTDGVYSVGSRTAGDETPCRIVVTNDTYISSVNGPGATVIAGQGPQGANAIRCAYVGGGAILEGFSLTNGHTRLTGGGNSQNGGGALCESDAILKDCAISGNEAASGGGVYGGRINESVLTQNTAIYGGGAYACDLISCQIVSNQATESGGGVFDGQTLHSTLQANTAIFGGGAYASYCERSYLSGNSATVSGGGVYDGWLRSCLVDHNIASAGGGAYQAYLENCTLVENTATNGGGAYGGSGVNSIIYFNSPTNWDGGDYTNSCSIPLLPGVDNIDDDPAFMDRLSGNYRLSPDSPCISAGRTDAWMQDALDLNGGNRICGSAPEMGAYEICILGAYDGVSAVLIIDATGSMNDNIEKVKLAVSNFVNGFSVRGIPVEIAGIRYSDSLSGGYPSDTPPSGAGFFSDASSFVYAWLDPLTLQHGGDEPEDALGALTYALDQTNFVPTYSSFYYKMFILITDASVKDLEDNNTGAIQWRADVIAALQTTNITLHAVRTPGIEDVEEIAEKTGGLLFDIDDEDYDEIFNTLLELY